MNRIFVEKKAGFNAEARHLLHDLHESLGLPQLSGLRILQRYDVAGLSDEEFAEASRLILSEPQVDAVSDSLTLSDGESAFAVEYLPGQFDQRADSAAQCVQILTGKDRPDVFSAHVYVLEGELSADELQSIKDYVINAVDSHEVPVDVETERAAPKVPEDVPTLEGFNSKSPSDIRKDLGLAMSAEDVAFCQDYFGKQEGREPTHEFCCR